MTPEHFSSANGGHPKGHLNGHTSPAALHGVALELTPSEPLFESHSPNLARRPVLRALIIAPGGKSLASRRMERFLIEGGHVLRHECSEAFEDEQRAARAFSVFEDAPETAPDILLLDCGTDVAAMEALCRRVAPARPASVACATIVAALPYAVLETHAGLWSTLHEAGADLLLDADAPTALLSSWLESAAQTARLERELTGAREQLSRHQQIDEVTGLLNRRFFFQAAYREVSRARRYGHPLSCLMFEVDHLAHFNESYGYACGDAILKSIASVIRTWTRDSDIAARFAGTKMVLLLPETRVEGAIALREKLLRVVDEKKFCWEGEELPVTVSIGEAQRAASAPEPRPNDVAGERNENGPEVSVREELADLLADADAALYVAKRGARTPAAFVEYTEGPEAGS